MRRTIILITTLAALLLPGVARAADTNPKLYHVPTVNTGACSNNDQNCFGGYSSGTDYGHPTINGFDANTARGWRVKISPTQGWTTGTNIAFATGWVGALNFSCLGNCGTHPLFFIQAGIIKGQFYSNSGALGCSGDTAGSIKVFWYSIDLSTGVPFDCGLGQIVSGGEGHTYTLQRIGTSNDNWGFYLDGVLQHTWTNLPSVLQSGNSIMECGAAGATLYCGGGPRIGPFALTDFGGAGTNSSPNWQVTNNTHATSGGWVNVRNSDATLSNDAGDYKVANITLGSPWEVCLDTGDICP